ncbi:MAG: GNAT family N-acetyltransferase [Candidatus Binatia bacterium]
MIQLEQIGPTSAPVFKNIRLRALQDSPTAFSSTYAEEFTLTDADWLKRASQWGGVNSVAYLALDAGNAVGIAAGVRDRNNLQRADLMSMWVAPAQRRLGIGRMLVDAVAAWARAQDMLYLCLMVTSNNDHAMRFYQSLGFALTGRNEPYRNDQSLLNFEMRRSLS